MAFAIPTGVEKIHVKKLGATSFDAKCDAQNLESHVNYLAEHADFRNWLDSSALNRAGNYVFEKLLEINENTTKQIYDHQGRDYFNVISSFGPEEAPRLIIGAHYDVCGNQAGADDNASGVAGILELSRMIVENDLELEYRIDIVAFTLEEPPFFRTFAMGSAIHAKYLSENNIDVIGMISVEMIGYFLEDKKTQGYPINALKAIYPSDGNFIAAVSQFGNGQLLRQVMRGLKKQDKIGVETLKAPASLVGVDFSDHLNYWQRGYEALMITDTSFYRNKNYHMPSDLPSTLNYDKMAAVVDGIFHFVMATNRRATT